MVAPTPWEELAGGMQIGDLVLFSGSENLSRAQVLEPAGLSLDDCFANTSTASLPTARSTAGDGRGAQPHRGR